MNILYVVLAVIGGGLVGGVGTFLMQGSKVANTKEQLERIKSALDEAEAEVETKENLLRELQEGQNKDRQKLEETYQQHLQELEKSYEAQIQQLRETSGSSDEAEQLRAQLKEIEASYQGQIEELKQSQASLEEVAQLQAELKQMEASYQAQIEAIQQSHVPRHELEQAKAEIEAELEASYQAQIAALPQPPTLDESQLRESIRAELEEIYRGQIQEIEQSYQTQIQELQNSHQAQLQEIEQAHQADIEELQAAHRIELQEIQQTVQTAVTEPPISPPETETPQDLEYKEPWEQEEAPSTPEDDFLSSLVQEELDSSDSEAVTMPLGEEDDFLSSLEEEAEITPLWDEENADTDLNFLESLTDNETQPTAELEGLDLSDVDTETSIEEQDFLEMLKTENDSEEEALDLEDFTTDEEDLFDSALPPNADFLEMVEIENKSSQDLETLGKEDNEDDFLKSINSDSDLDLEDPFALNSSEDKTNSNDENPFNFPDLDTDTDFLDLVDNDDEKKSSSKTDESLDDIFG